MSIEAVVNKVIDEWEREKSEMYFGTYWREKLIKELHQELIRMTKHQPCHHDEDKIAKYIKQAEQLVFDMHFKN